MTNKNIIKPMGNFGNFKASNLRQWKLNSDYWLNSSLRHVEDNISFIDDLVSKLSTNKSTIVDMGCGNGFLYKLLRKHHPDATYIGLDFNESFITYLDKNYSNDTNARFILLDVENKVPEYLLECADVVFNFFNFFELEDFYSAFNNAVKILKPGGTLSIQTIEYTYLLLAISNSMDVFKENLVKYEEIKMSGQCPFTFQKIDQGDSENKSLSYGSVFYSTSDYLNAALDNCLTLKSFKENIKTNKFHPKVYQYYEFEKPV